MENTNQKANNELTKFMLEKPLEEMMLFVMKTQAEILERIKNLERQMVMVRPLRIREACCYLGVTENDLRSIVNKRLVKCYYSEKAKKHFFYKEDLDKFIRGEFENK